MDLSSGSPICIMIRFVCLSSWEKLKMSESGQVFSFMLFKTHD